MAEDTQVGLHVTWTNSPAEPDRRYAARDAGTEVTSPGRYLRTSPTTAQDGGTGPTWSTAASQDERHAAQHGLGATWSNVGTWDW